MATDVMKRRVEFLRSAASYALSNLDDLNEALGTDYTEMEASQVLGQLQFALTGELPDDDLAKAMAEAERDIADAQAMADEKMRPAKFDTCDKCGKILLESDFEGGRCTGCLTMILPKGP